MTESLMLARRALALLLLPAILFLFVGAELPIASVYAGPTALDEKQVDGKEAEKKRQPSKFSRFLAEWEEEGVLETALVTYENEDGVEVTLAAAVHIGDTAYYKNLEKHFATRDAVLFELVAHPSQAKTRSEGSGSILSFFQRAMKTILKLDFQLDAIDYTKDNFVHADMDPVTFRRMQAERGESIFTLMLDAMKKELANTKEGKQTSEIGFMEIIHALTAKDSARALKMLLARELESMEDLLAGIEEGPDGKGSVIVTERNKIAMEVLAKEMETDKKKFCIFYGAAHMADFERRLWDLGFERKKHEWVTAWNMTRTEKDGEKKPEKKPEKKRERF